MALAEFKAENFRCLESVALEAEPDRNLIYGDNASGKTSLLEAIAFLGRGRSFRGASTQTVVRRGAQHFLLFGRTDGDPRGSTLGVRNGAAGLEIRVDQSDAGVSDLAGALPLQVIDPDVHGLVSGGPDGRRRFLDWIAFHVEQDFLDDWRRFRRALKQRNAALKSGQGLSAWTAEFVAIGERIDQHRRRALAAAVSGLERHSEALLGVSVAFEYQAGWSQDRALAEVLAEGVDRDTVLGSTQAGPHRADLRLVLEERQAKRVVSRGQQKLLACAMILGATEVVQAQSRRRLVLLIDDPAAELDRRALSRLMQQVFSLDCQLFATSLERDLLEFPKPPAVFHVERGVLTRE